MSDLQYPIGKAVLGPLSPDARAGLIAQIEALPLEMRSAVAGLSDAQLDTPYRPGGWTVRQVVHHVPDSHMNAYVRVKLALTEDTPTIRPYEQTGWAKLGDSAAPPEGSLALLESLHARWTLVWRSLEPGQFARTFLHPVNGPTTLDDALASYAWHGRHHVAHITGLRGRMGW